MGILYYLFVMESSPVPPTSIDLCCSVLQIPFRLLLLCIFIFYSVGSLFACLSAMFLSWFFTSLLNVSLMVFIFLM